MEPGWGGGSFGLPPQENIEVVNNYYENAPNSARESSFLPTGHSSSNDDFSTDNSNDGDFENPSASDDPTDDSGDFDTYSDDSNSGGGNDDYV